MKQVNYASDSVKALQRMDRSTAQRIKNKVRQYAEDPASLTNNVKTLKGELGLKRLRIGDWRVIFTEDIVVLSVVRIASRGSVYE